MASTVLESRSMRGPLNERRAAAKLVLIGGGAAPPSPDAAAPALPRSTLFLLRFLSTSKLDRGASLLLPGRTGTRARMATSSV